MKKILLILFSFAFTVISPVLGQTHFHFIPIHNVDKPNLLKRLRAAKTDTAKLNRLNDLVFYYTLVESPDDIDTVSLDQLIALNESARLIDSKPYLTLREGLRAGKKKNAASELILLKQAVDEFDTQNIEIPALLTEMRYLFNVTNNQEDRFEFYSKKIPHYIEKGEPDNAAACYHCLAGYYVFKGDLNSAINNYLRASELYRSFSNLWCAHELGIVGEFYIKWGNRAKGLYYLQKTFDLEKQWKITIDAYNLLSTFAETEYNLRHYESSLRYLKKMDSVPFGSATIDSVSNQVSTFVLRSLDFTALKRLPEAYEQLHRAKQLPALSDIAKISSTGLYEINYGFYKYYMALNNRGTAEGYLLNGYHGAQKNSQTDSKLLYLNELQQFYSDENNTAKAWKYAVLYNRINDSVQSLTNGFKVASYENEQKEVAQNKKLVVLQRQRAVQEATITQRNIIIWLSLIGLLVVLGSLMFIYRQLRINKQNLSHLKITQTQLIQAEKMASLGELTAGIAHEIQNPLNFVNNFSEVNAELIGEMQLEIEKGDLVEIKAVAINIQENEKKINLHGKRADAIVKGMLQHSQAGSGAKEPTGINALADEVMRLAYHGFRAKDKSFNAELITNFDDELPKISVIPQDIGRVMLNLFNNAFYAVNQKVKTVSSDYKPEVSVTTSKENSHIVVKVKDNGVGIPDAIKDKILQPFFTTKPTGEGTGLGLSLTYDMIVNGHNGRIEFGSKEGKYTEFTIYLPLS